MMETAKRINERMKNKTVLLYCCYLVAVVVSGETSFMHIKKKEIALCLNIYIYIIVY